MAPHPAPCGGRGGIVEVGAAGEEVGTAGAGTAGEEVGIAGGGTGGGAGRQVSGGDDTVEEVGGADGAGEDAVFSPRRLPPRPFPPLPDGRRPELSTASMAPPGAPNPAARLCCTGREEDGARGGKDWGTGREGLESRAPGARDRWG